MKKVLMLGFIVLFFCSYVAAETGQLQANTRITQLGKVEKNLVSNKVSANRSQSLPTHLAKSDMSIENSNVNNLNTIQTEKTNVIKQTTPSIKAAKKLEAQAIQQRNGHRSCPGTVVYSNTQEGNVNYYTPGEGVAIADDIIFSVEDGGPLLCYEIGYVYIEFQAPYVTVNAALYDDFPDDGGQLIPGTEATWIIDDEVEEGYLYILTAELAQSVIINQNYVFLVMETDNGDENGFPLAGEAEIGYTNDWFCDKDPDWLCGWYFGGDPWSGFWAELYMALDLDPCVTCPPGGILEGEPACGPNYDDTYNGGCNSDVPVFQAINSGDVICGQTGVFDYYGDTYRDTDWFSFTLSEEKIVEFEVYGELPLFVAVAAPGPNGCDDFDILGGDSTLYCEPIELYGILPPGTYWLVILPDDFSTYWECEIPYIATFNTIDLDPCVTCPPGGIPEGEPACGPDYIDTFNGGCNSSPSVFQPINNGDVICGQTGVFVNSDDTVSRDTDWFVFQVAEYSLVEWEAYGESPLYLALLKPGTAIPDGCANLSSVGAAESDYCETATLRVLVEPGTYWAFVSVAEFNEYYECEVPYVATINWESADPEGCGPDSIFSQPFAAEVVYVNSDQNSGIIVADDFSGLTDAITAVEWWGGNVTYTTGWQACSKPNSNFIITFYEPGTVPGNVVYQKTVAATKVQTPQFVFGQQALGNVMRYKAVLPTPVTISAGWISIQAVDSGTCWFMWADAGEPPATGSAFVRMTEDEPQWQLDDDADNHVDLAFCLIGGESEPKPIPATSPVGISIALLVIGIMIALPMLRKSL